MLIKLPGDGRPNRINAVIKAAKDLWSHLSNRRIVRFTSGVDKIAFTLYCSFLGFLR